ncbi:MAG: hypothetical protein KC736_01610 [Candidatus Moranbacteria bacterium]|nr:hypothetical protein [Candidatus Moranbacteria bacterium]
MSNRVAIIGPQDVVSGFSAVGVIAFVANTSADVMRLLEEFSRSFESSLDSEIDRYPVVIVMEELLKDIPQDEYARVTRHVLPAVVALPGLSGSSGYTSERLRALAQRAVGIDIFS